MKTVTTDEHDVKPLPQEIDAVIDWHTHKAKRGELPNNTARLRSTALRQICSVLDEQDPSDLGWIAANLESLANRFAIKSKMNGETVATYMTRARTALTDYACWKEAPQSFAFRVRAVSQGDRPRKATAPVEVQAAPVEVPAPDAAPAMQFEGAAYVGRLPLSDGRVFSFTLPKGGITRRDLRRISHHLMTLCEDFDVEQEPGLVVRSE